MNKKRQAHLTEFGKFHYGNLRTAQYIVLIFTVLLHTRICVQFSVLAEASDKNVENLFISQNKKKSVLFSLLTCAKLSRESDERKWKAMVRTLQNSHLVGNEHKYYRNREKILLVFVHYDLSNSF